MKKIFVLTILLVSGIQLFGQIQQGKVLLSGQLSYTKSGDFDAYEIGVLGGYFVTDKAAIGLAVSVGKELNPNLIFLLFGEAEYKSVALFSRHYFTVGDEGKFYFFLQPSFTFTKTSFEDSDGDEFEFDSKILGVSPGFVFYPAPKVGIELSLNGLMYQFAEDEGDGTFTLDLKPLSPTLGNYILAGKLMVLYSGKIYTL